MSGTLGVPSSQRHGFPRSDMFTLLLILLVGSTVPLSERLVPQRYSSQPDLPAALAVMGNDSGLDAAALQNFLSQPGAGIWQGRMLYPRFYDIDKGETASDLPYNVQPYPRMAFTLIGPAGQTGVTLPGPARGRFASGMDALVLGCFTPVTGAAIGGGIIDALAVLPLDRAETVSLREPLPELTCPLRPPVCADQKTCD